MKGGFKLLETRSIDNVSELQKYEVQLGLKLPSKYKLFLETFKVGENKVQKERYMLDGDLYPCSSYVYKPMEYIGFSHFLTTDMSCNVWIDLNDLSYARINGLIPIGATGTSAIIFLGSSGQDSDKIFLEYENDWTYICDNIFEFVRGLDYWTREDDPNSRQTIPFSKLSRNWREDFWRIKNNQEA